MQRTVNTFLPNSLKPPVGMAPACAPRMGDWTLIAGGFDGSVVRTANARTTSALATRGAC